MVITSLQLVQMIIGCVVNYMAFNYKQNGQFYNRNTIQQSWLVSLLSGLQCGVSDTNLKLSLLMYCSYFVLFARFFYNAYVNKYSQQKQVQGKLQDEDKKSIEEKSDATKKDE